MLYWVEQNFIQQQSQHIAVGSVIAQLVVHLPVKETAEGSTPSNV